MNDSCNICGTTTTLLEDPQLRITYFVCNHCGFMYKHPQFHVSLEDEKREYDTHENSFESTGYVQMFERFIEDFIRPLGISGVGLEFGSGPGPVLKELLTKEGFTMYDYDYFYNPNTNYKTRQYDLITSTEVFEHFTNPLQEITALTDLLKPGGYMVVMTRFNTFDEDGFLQWWYRRDITHVSFYRVETIEFLTKTLGMHLVTHNGVNVFVWRKESTSTKSC